MDKLFDLRDKGFREYFFKSSHNAEWLNSIMDKEEINNKDLIRFYLEYSKLCDNYPLLITSFNRILFNYKMLRISDERVDKFHEIIKSKTGISVEEAFYLITGESSSPLARYVYYNFKVMIKNDEVFQELVDIFLDQI